MFSNVVPDYSTLYPSQVQERKNFICSLCRNGFPALIGVIITTEKGFYRENPVTYRKLKCMRTIFTLFLSVILVIVFQSCSKSGQDEMVLTPAAGEQINATIAANSAYEISLDDYTSAVISKQAAHHAESFTGIDEKTGRFRYRYVPALNFSGMDEVTLKSTKTVVGYANGPGCNRSSESGGDMSEKTVTRYLTIRIRVN